MSEDNKLSSSEIAYRAVLAVQEHKARAENAWSGPDTSNQQSTPWIVWGALLGMFIGAFSIGSSGFLLGVVKMLIGMAIGAGFFWGVSKVFFLFLRLLGFIFRGFKRAE